MLPCHSCYIGETLRSKELGGLKLSIVLREGEKSQTRGIFMGRHNKTTQGVDH